MRWTSPVLAAAIGLGVAACSPAGTPEPVTPEGSTAETPPEPETPTTDAAPVPQVIHYDCEGIAVDASFDGRDQAVVSLEGTTYAMRTEAAGSGAKYVDDAGNVFWTRGTNEALLMRPDQPDRSCSGSPAAPT